MVCKDHTCTSSPRVIKILIRRKKEKKQKLSNCTLEDAFIKDLKAEDILILTNTMASDCWVNVGSASSQITQSKLHSPTHSPDTS